MQWGSVLQGMGESVLVRDRYQDVLLSANAVVVHCDTIWVSKRKIYLYVTEIFWKDTKETL